LCRWNSFFSGPSGIQERARENVPCVYGINSGWIFSNAGKKTQKIRVPEKFFAENAGKSFRKNCFAQNVPMHEFFFSG